MKAIRETEVTEAASAAIAPQEADMDLTSESSSPTRSRGNARKGSTSIAGPIAAAALAVMLGCAAKAPVASVTPVVAQTAPRGCDDSPGWCVVPAANGAYTINGLVTCSFVNETYTTCVLDSGATLDDFVNSVTEGVGVNEE